MHELSVSYTPVICDLYGNPPSIYGHYLTDVLTRVVSELYISYAHWEVWGLVTTSRNQGNKWVYTPMGGGPGGGFAIFLKA